MQNITMSPTKSKLNLIKTISNIRPFDAIEQKQISDTISWIKSGVEIYRIQKPDIPNKHLVAYAVVVDVQKKEILLGEHKLANLWLPTGGHVEENEDPLMAAIRECNEELNILAKPWQNAPLFLTVTTTVGIIAQHTDVSLWYVINGSSSNTYAFDTREFASINWYKFSEIPFASSDPNMHRFVSKLDKIL